MSTPFFTASRLARPAARFFTSTSPPLRLSAPFRAATATAAPAAAAPRRGALSHTQLILLGGLVGLSLTALPSSFRLDAPAGTYPLTTHKTVVSAPGAPPMVATGNATVPAVPATMTLDDGTEYTLLGFGVRTVSFLRIQVYIASLYVATADLPALAASLIKAVNPAASTLLPSERAALQTLLLDASHSDDLWDTLLTSSPGIRSAIRISPVRDTDFQHLRDGFVRAIQARTRAGASVDDRWAFGDAGFGESMGRFRGLFGAGKVPKQRELVLVRAARGALRVLYDDGVVPGRQELGGGVQDERVSRMLWLNYLGGKTVASEAARQSIAEGLLDLAGRPVGSV